jgi:acetyltransferase-like isoleucine patch superfamily enzyme
MQEVTDLIGLHYEPVSTLYRLLGAKVGKRVFSPGNQPVFSGEFDLLEIGDDVVFGSRTTILCSTTESLEKVVFCAGSNVSDNTVVLPVSIIGRNAVLGSNTVCPAGRYLPEASIWLGSHAGEPMMLDPGT